MSGHGWDSIITKLIDDFRRSLRLMAIILLCSAIVLVALGIAKPAEYVGAVEFALFVVVLAAICAALSAGVKRWLRTRASDRNA